MNPPLFSSLDLTIEQFPYKFLGTNIQDEKDLTQFLSAIIVSKENVIPTLNILNHFIVEFESIKSIKVKDQIDRILEISWNLSGLDQKIKLDVQYICLNLANRIYQTAPDLKKPKNEETYSIELLEQLPLQRFLWVIYEWSVQNNNEVFQKNLQTKILKLFYMTPFKTKVILYPLIEIFEHALKAKDPILQDKLLSFILAQFITDHGQLNFVETDETPKIRTRLDKLINETSFEQKDISKIFAALLNHKSEEILNELILKTKLFENNEIKLNPFDYSTRIKIWSAFLYRFFHSNHSIKSNKKVFTDQFHLIPLFNHLRTIKDVNLQDLAIISIYSFYNLTMVYNVISSRFKFVNRKEFEELNKACGVLILADVAFHEKTIKSNVLLLVKFQIALQNGYNSLTVTFQNNLIKNQCPTILISTLNTFISKGAKTEALLFMENLETLRDLEEPSFRYLTRKIEILTLNDKFDEAYALMPKLKTINPETLKVKCLLMTLQKNWAEVEKLLTENADYANDQYKNILFHYLKLFLGIAYFNTNRIEKAKEIFDELYYKIDTASLNQNPLINTLITTTAIQLKMKINKQLQICSHNIEYNMALFETICELKSANINLAALVKISPPNISLMIFFAKTMVSKHFYQPGLEAIKLVLKIDLKNKEAQQIIDDILQYWKEIPANQLKYIHGYHKNLMDLMD